MKDRARDPTRPINVSVSGTKGDWATPEITREIPRHLYRERGSSFLSRASRVIQIASAAVVVEG